MQLMINQLFNATDPMAAAIVFCQIFFRYCVLNVFSHCFSWWCIIALGGIVDRRGGALATLVYVRFQSKWLNAHHKAFDRIEHVFMSTVLIAGMMAFSHGSNDVKMPLALFPLC